MGDKENAKSTALTAYSLTLWGILPLASAVQSAQIAGGGL